MLFDNKGTFSDINFVEPHFDKIKAENAKRISDAGRISDLGRKADVLVELHKQVLQEIDELKDFCKDCKPKKNK